MQQHTGQHVLSQAFWELLKGETLSFHMGPEVSTLEIGLKALSDADFDRVEDRANAIVREDREVKTYFVPEERIGEVPSAAPAQEARPPAGRRGRRLRLLGLRRYARPEDRRDRRDQDPGSREDPGQPSLRVPLRRPGPPRPPRQGPDGSSARGGLLVRAGRRRRAGRAARRRTQGPEETGPPPRGAAGRLRSGRGRPHGDRIASSPGSSGTRPPRKPASWPSTSSGTASSTSFTAPLSESQGHLIVARSESLKTDLRQLAAVIGAVLPVKGGGGPSLIELVTAEKARLREAVDAAVAWVRANAEKPGA